MTLRRRRLAAALLVAASASSLVLLPAREPGHEPSTSARGSPVGARTQADPRLTVVGVGDSVMSGSHCGCAGISAQYAAAWGRRLHRAVRSVNLGVPGDTTTTLESRLDGDATTRTDLQRADVVLVIEGANDLVPQLDEWRDTGCSSSCYLPAVQEMGARLGAALADIRRLAPARAQVVVAGYWDVFPDGDTARAGGGDALIDWSRQVTAAADVAIARAAAPDRATYVDLTASFLADGTKDPTPLLAEDGDHPNEAGVRAIVDDLLHATRAPSG